MSRDLNKVQLIGRLTSDPEARKTNSGKIVVVVGLATNKIHKDGTGSTEYHKIVAWEKLGEICATYLKKGALVFFEGRLHTNSWETDEGNKMYRAEVVADNMIMLDRRPKEEQVFEGEVVEETA